MCGSVEGANINTVCHFSIFPRQWLPPHNTLGVTDPEKLFREHGNMHRMSYLIQWKKLLVWGRWHSSQVQSGEG